MFVKSSLWFLVDFGPGHGLAAQQGSRWAWFRIATGYLRHGTTRHIIYIILLGVSRCNFQLSTFQEKTSPSPSPSSSSWKKDKALDTAVATFGATSWAALPMDCTAFSMWSWAPLYQWDWCVKEGGVLSCTSHLLVLPPHHQNEEWVLLLRDVRFLTFGEMPPPFLPPTSPGPRLHKGRDATTSLRRPIVADPLQNIATFPWIHDQECMESTWFIWLQTRGQ